VRGASSSVVILRIAGIVLLDLGANLTKETSLLLGVNGRPLHLNDSRLLEDNTVLVLGLITLINHLAIRSPNRLARDLGVTANATQNTVGKVPRWRSTARGRRRSAVHLFTEGSKSV
jgi:hypothetical protein